MYRVRIHHGLTLIELILVMALLATVMAVSSPMLSGFFAGRTLEEEARRFLALTRYARSEAVSRSLLMELWIRPDIGAYGTMPKNSTELQNANDVEFILGRGLSFNINAAQLNEKAEAVILFWPDGSIDDQSLFSLLIESETGQALEIRQDDFGIRYLIQDEVINGQT